MCMCACVHACIHAQVCANGHRILASPFRMEVVQIFKQKNIQASMTGFSFIAVVPTMLFPVFVPSVLTGNVQSLSAYFIVLSKLLFSKAELSKVCVQGRLVVTHSRLPP